MNIFLEVELDTFKCNYCIHTSLQLKFIANIIQTRLSYHVTVDIKIKDRRLCLFPFFASCMSTNPNDLGAGMSKNQANNELLPLNGDQNKIILIDALLHE